MRALALEFLRGTPVSILVAPAGAWLMLRRTVRDPQSGEEWVKEWFIPPSTDPSIVERALAQFQIPRSPGLALFLREFAGLREELPGTSGHFPRVQDWLAFEQYVVAMGWQVSKPPRVWGRAVVFFESLCGDVLLLDRTGRLGWWDHGCNEFQVLFQDFRNFPAHFLKYVRRSYPLSAWGPEE